MSEGVPFDYSNAGGWGAYRGPRQGRQRCARGAGRRRRGTGLAYCGPGCIDAAQRCRSAAPPLHSAAACTEGASMSAVLAVLCSEMVHGMATHPLAREPAHYGPVRSMAAAVSCLLHRLLRALSCCTVWWTSAVWPAARRALQRAGGSVRHRAARPPRTCPLPLQVGRVWTCGGSSAFASFKEWTQAGVLLGSQSMRTTGLANDMVLVSQLVGVQENQRVSVGSMGGAPGKPAQSQPSLPARPMPQRLRVRCAPRCPRCGLPVGARPADPVPASRRVLSLGDNAMPQRPAPRQPAAEVQFQRCSVLRRGFRVPCPARPCRHRLVHGGRRHFADRIAHHSQPGGGDGRGRRAWHEGPAALWPLLCSPSRPFCTCRSVASGPTNFCAPRQQTKANKPQNIPAAAYGCGHALAAADGARQRHGAGKAGRWQRARPQQPTCLLLHPAFWGC